MSSRLILVLSAIWLLALAAVTWFVVDPAKYAFVAAARRIGHMPGPAAASAIAVQHLDLPGALLLLSALLLGLTLVVIEWRYCALSEAIARDPPVSVALMLATVLWFGHSYLLPGHLLMGDLGNHIALVTLRTAAISGGHDPYWTNWQSLGQPLASFYSPTSFMPITAISRLTGDPTLATKLFLLLAHVLSGLAGWWLARTLGAGLAGSFIGAVAIAGSFAHLHLILYRGTVPQALSIALLPFALACLHLVLTQQRHVTLAWVGLAIGSAGLLANYTPFGVIAGLFLGLYALTLLISRAAPWRRLVSLITAGCMAIALAAVVLLPAMLASGDNESLSIQRLVGLALPDRTYFDHLLVWRAWRTNYGHDSSAYLGITVVVLAALGLVAALRERGQQCSIGVALFLMLLFSLVIRGDYLRSVVFTLLAVATLAAFGTDALLARFVTRRSAVAMITGLVLLDLGSTAIQPLARMDLGASDVAGRYLAAQRPRARTLQGSVEDGFFVASRSGGAGILQLYPAEFVSGGYSQFAGYALVFGEIAGLMVEDDLAASGGLRPDTRAFLCQLRVGQIVASNRTEMGLPAMDETVAEGPLGRIIRTDCPYAVIFAPALSLVGPDIGKPLVPNDTVTPANDESLRQARALIAAIDDEMGLNPTTGMAARILVRDPSASLRSPDGPGAAPTIHAYEVTSDRVRIALTAPSAGFVQLSHAWFPRLTVSVNGVETSSWADVMGLLVVPVPAGSTVIEIYHRSEPGTAIGAAISTGALLVLAGLLVQGFRAGRRR